MIQANVLADFLAYSDHLTKAALSDENVLGLVFLGSAAKHSRIDQWSDHDFFWVVKKNQGEKYRTNLTWIPDWEQISIAVRETDHGLKVLFADGRILEFAVFEDQELELASVNSWLVTVDKADIALRMQKIQDRSFPLKPFDWAIEFQLFLINVLLGVGRARRGEILIAGQFIRTYALRSIVKLIKESTLPKLGTEGLEDNLEILRRFEFQYPVEAALIEQACQNTVEIGAMIMLKIVEGLNPITAAEIAQIAVVRERLEKP